MQIDNIDIEHTKRIVTRREKVAMKAFRSLLSDKGHEVEIEGQKVLIKPLNKVSFMDRPEGYEDEYDKQWEFTVDCWFDDGCHIEMTVHRTGWGAPMGIAAEKPKLVKD